MKYFVFFAFIFLFSCSKDDSFSKQDFYGEYQEYPCDQSFPVADRTMCLDKNCWSPRCNTECGDWHIEDGHIVLDGAAYKIIYVNSKGFAIEFTNGCEYRFQKI